MANIRSTLNKLDDIYLSVLNGGYEIFAATDSWLDKNIPDNILNMPNFDLFRCDRVGRLGDGVCVGVNSTLKMYDVSNLIVSPITYKVSGYAFQQ